MPDNFEIGGDFVPHRSAQGYTFEVPDYTDEIIALDQGEDRRKVILKLIEKHKPQRDRMLMNHQRYKTDASGVPVFHRIFERDVTIDNRINNDYFSEIVDIKTGYFAGKPAAYAYDKQEQNFEQVSQRIKDFLEMNRIADVNMETTKYCAIGGYSARLLYIDTAGRERMMYIPGHQAILLNEDGNIIETRYGVRYYGQEGRYIIHFYDGLRRYKYQQDGAELNLLEDNIHTFKLCPLFGYPNNDELMGDPDKVLGLIDAIDRTISDVNSEIEAFRLAYLLFLGAQVDQTAVDEMRKTGAISIPGMGGERIDARFLEKNLNDGAIENHLNRIHDNIYRFSGTPDLADEAFSGNQSGESLKFKLFGLETKSARFEQKFKAADTRMFEIMSTKWAIESLVVNPYKVFAEFKRNFPQNLLNEADIQQKLKGLVSEQTRLSLASFVDDVEYELELMEQEANGIEPLDLESDAEIIEGETNAVI
ncbi:phage portal protein [Exiguobacterium sp. MER 193]|uniref:phage portal protein n=1 Tax=Exiguobacterium sp. MER 193 TaxID=2939564 RepID=UPI00203B64D9|nr:phage portal protein [Exiguobacterium sp. MER 193]MCM3281487.1 phage portal protein [Exiguobacterium sp. MER 193]